VLSLVTRLRALKSGAIDPIAGPVEAAVTLAAYDKYKRHAARGR